jgi:hypothetical protein
MKRIGRIWGERLPAQRSITCGVPRNLAARRFMLGTSGLRNRHSNRGSQNVPSAPDVTACRHARLFSPRSHKLFTAIADVLGSRPLCVPDKHVVHVVDDGDRSLRRLVSAHRQTLFEIPLKRSAIPGAVLRSFGPGKAQAPRTARLPSSPPGLRRLLQRSLSQRERDRVRGNALSNCYCSMVVLVHAAIGFRLLLDFDLDIHIAGMRETKLQRNALSFF